jgi:hypothetical protein
MEDDSFARLAAATMRAHVQRTCPLSSATVCGLFAVLALDSGCEASSDGVVPPPAGSQLREAGSDYLMITRTTESGTILLEVLATRR